MMQATMLDIPIIIGNADYRAQGLRGFTHDSDNRTHGVSACNGTLDGRFFSKISKIRRYSSAHDDGLTNP